MAVQISGNDITVPRDGSFTRNVTIGGTLTYEDVTNIDSVGLVTARTGIEIGARPGVAASISVDGNMIVSGISTFGGAANFDDVSAATLTSTGDVTLPDSIIHSGDTNTKIRFPAADTVSVETGGSERARIDSSGRLIVGTNTSRSVGDVTAQIQLEGTGFASSSLSLISNAGASSGNTPHLTLGKSRGSSDGSNTIVASGDALGQIQFSGADGTDCNTVASSIIGRVDGTPGSNDMPGNLTFNTTADGAASPTERMRISKEGYVTKPALPAFHANGSPSHSNFTGYDNSVHSFANVPYNNGSHYNNSTGRFTAPVAGFYWFSAGLWSSNSDESNGTYLLVFARQDSDASNELQFAGCNHRYEKVQLTLSAGINMTAGQTLRLWHNGSNASSTPRNFFSGYLVG